jgi:hypothetical protein
VEPGDFFYIPAGYRICPTIRARPRRSSPSSRAPTQMNRRA